MRGRPIKIEWEETPEELYKQYKRENDTKTRQKLQFLWLIREGHTVEASSQIAGIGERSGQRYLSWYRQNGLAEVISRKHGGHTHPQRWLTSKQEKELVQYSEKGVIKTVWDGVNWAKETHEVSYSYEGMRTVFKRLGLNKKVPRPQHEKSDKAAQNAWKKGGSVVV